jgi:hypothetical protein
MGPFAWSVFDALEADTALGHIQRDGDRYRVGLVGDELESYSFATLRESEAWFTEYLFAMSLGRPPGAADGAAAIRTSADPERCTPPDC